MVTNKHNINDILNTVDGKGIIKNIIVLGDISDEKIGYVCILKKPYIIIDEWDGTKKFGFFPYAFGYTYNENGEKIN